MTVAVNRKPIAVTVSSVRRSHIRPMAMLSRRVFNALISVFL